MQGWVAESKRVIIRDSIVCHIKCNIRRSLEGITGPGN